MIAGKFSDLPEGYQLRTYDVVDSTNAECRRLADQGEADNIWVRADEQTAGRGRRGREWVSKPGNLFASLLYGVNCDPLTAAGLSLVAAVAVREVVANILSDDALVTCKWPNDILVGGNKIAGILLETTGTGGEFPSHVIIGIGINIICHPQQVHYPATDLKSLLGRGMAADQVMMRLVSTLARWLSRWQRFGFEPVRQAWKDKCSGLGQNIIIRLPDKELRGRFVDLDHTGALILEFGGERRHITSGDIFFA